MSPALLTALVPVGAGSHPALGAEPARPSLDEELGALFRGEIVECLVCGEPVDVEDNRAECRSCGTLVEPAPVVIEGQLELL
jgi:hypothetical protein